jgi:ferrous iron transport protein B
MGLTYQSTGKGAMDNFSLGTTTQDSFVVALAGNPNVGKSTVFNALTGLRQHTGNWPGKTVTNARGNFSHCGQQFTLVDLPGTYSLFAHSAEEEVARDFICFGKPHATIIVTDATCLERNLNLALQVIEITPKAVVCVNLIDEAERKNIHVDMKILEEELGVPVVATAAREGRGLDDLRNTIYQLATEQIQPSPKRILYPREIEEAITELQHEFKQIPDIDPRWVALRMLDGDKSLIESMKKYLAPFGWGSTVTTQ